MNDVTEPRWRIARLSALTLALIAPVALVASCGRTAVRVAESTDVAVYAAALDSLFAPGDSALPRPIVLLDSTTRLSENVKDSSRSIGFAERTPISLLPIAARLKSSVKRPLIITANSILLALQQSRDSALAKLPPEQRFRRVDMYWQIFHEKFPGAFGYASLSTIELDSSGSEALVLVRHSCGSLCGSGNLIRLKRVGDAWRVVSIQELWVS